MPPISFARSALVLGLLAVVGPFAIDLYLPAIPQIAHALQASDAAMQMTFMVYFLAFALAQLLYGPLADRFGRKLPTYIGLGIFILGSVLCAVANEVSTLLVGRFVQALGAGAPMIICRAVIRDLHTGNEATRLMALVMLVISISPLLAPLVGSAIIAVGDWHLIFVALVVMGFAALLLMMWQMPETLPPERRRPINLADMGRSIRILVSDVKFMGLALTGGFGIASFFVFVATAPLVYMTAYQLTPTQFSLAFALTALGFFGASQLAAPLGQRFGMMRVALRAVAGFAASTVLLFVLVWAGFNSLGVMLTLLFISNSFLGLVIAPTMVMALEEHGERAGIASSLAGTLQMLTGGLMILAFSPILDRTPLPLTAAIATSGLIALGCALVSMRQPKSKDAAVV